MRKEKGQSLVEALVALAAAVVIVTGITVAVITSISNSDFSKYQNLSTQYAQQGLEILKQQSESNWASFALLNGVYCLSQNSTALVSPGAGSCPPNIQNSPGNNFFVRQINISQNDPSCSSNAAKVSVNVSWSDGKCTDSSNVYCHGVKLDSCLANINVVPTP